MANVKEKYLHQKSSRLYYQPVTWDLLPEWTRFFGAIPRVDFLGMDSSLDPEIHAKSAIQRQLDRYDENGWGHVATFIEETEEFIGMCGLVPRELTDINTMEVHHEMEAGYALIPDFWGKGYATEMAVTMRDFCFEYLDFPRCVSMINHENEPSKKVARRNGMKMLYEATYEGDVIQVFGVER